MGFEWPSELKLLVACGGIFFSFSYFAVLQEDVYKTDYGGEKFKFTFLALLVERGINAVIAAMGVAVFGGSGLKIPYMDIFNSGISQMLAMAGSNEALRYVSYPTQVLGKSCKMVPVMAGGLLLGGKSYTVFEYLQVVLITGGVVVFNFGGKSKAGGADSTYGLALIAFSLFMDMVTGGLQDKVKKSTKELNPSVKGAKPTMHESMMWTNVSGALVAGVLALLTGHLSEGLAFCTRNPEVLMAILVYSLASAVGQNFIYYTVTEFGPLLLTTVTTTRKIFSTLYSVFRNPENSLSEMQWGGCCLVFAGLLLDVAAKYMPGKKPADKPAATEMKEVKGDSKPKGRTAKAD
jgi:UDP-galactose transporter B1